MKNAYVWFLLLTLFTLIGSVACAMEQEDGIVMSDELVQQLLTVLSVENVARLQKDSAYAQPEGICVVFPCDVDDTEGAEVAAITEKIEKVRFSGNKRSPQRSPPCGVFGRCACGCKPC